MARAEDEARTVLIGSQKGGVGKTSLVAGLGALAARPQPGRRVLLIDGDQQSNLSKRNLGLEGDGGRGPTARSSWGSRSTQYGTCVRGWT